MPSTKVSAKLNDILQNLKKTNDKPNAVEDDIVEKVVLQQIPRGRPKSGKIWKNKKERFSTIKKTKGVHKTFAEKQALRTTLKVIKEASKAIQEQKKIEKEANKERRRINIKRTEENRLKSEIVQVISNSAKVKRMKKKQLRFIEKRDTTKISK